MALSMLTSQWSSKHCSKLCMRPCAHIGMLAFVYAYSSLYVHAVCVAGCICMRLCALHECMCACVHVCICACVHQCVVACVLKSVCVHVCAVRVCACICACMCVRMHRCIMQCARSTWDAVVCIANPLTCVCARAHNKRVCLCTRACVCARCTPCVLVAEVARSWFHARALAVIDNICTRFHTVHLPSAHSTTTEDRTGPKLASLPIIRSTDVGVARLHRRWWFASTVVVGNKR